MLNISLNSINSRVKKDTYYSFKLLEKKTVSKVLVKILLTIGFLFVAAMFLPWTQNIRAKGYVNTLRPEDRPQNIQTLIGGKIEKWYVMEGQKVEKGDTIVLISEVKEEYLDPDILNRTSDQIDAKSASAGAYDQKVVNLQSQITALENGLAIKLEQNSIKLNQTLLKIASDSMELIAASAKEKIANDQLIRNEELLNAGLKSLTDVEAKRLSFQESRAKRIALENKINEGKNELLNIKSNIIGLKNEYMDKIAKSKSEIMSAISEKYDAVANVNKLQSMYNTYNVRQQNYYIKAPISGIVTKAIQSGIGEIVKNGENIVSIMPTNYQLAVEMYVRPVDVPLLKIGQEVRTQFDGWPAIVFSGWPNSSFGTYSGQIYAIDNFISKNGKYRILVAPIEGKEPWPDQVKVGGGANTIILLKNVSLGYEFWRQLNGFPPDYYEEEKEESFKSKIPLQKVK